MTTNSPQPPKSILVLGLLGAFVDRHPEINVTNAQIATTLDGEVAKASEAGYTMEYMGYDPDEEFVEDSLRAVWEKLRASYWTVVAVGFGIRGQPQHTSAFERAVNLVVEVSREREREAGEKEKGMPVLAFPVEPGLVWESCRRVISFASA